MQIHSVVFVLSLQINMQKYAKTSNLLCVGNKVFAKYQAQEGLTQPPLAHALGWKRTFLPMATTVFLRYIINT